ncbi:MAG: C45 family autoproteolytic acyltransferase/hydrolase [Candidatus Hodarchaeales archaeon]
MYQVKLKGSYYEMGYTQGKMLKDKSLPGDFILNPASETRKQFTEECENIIRKYAPEILDELRGLSDGADIDYDIIKIWPLSLYSKLDTCSIVVVSSEYTENGKPLFIRNYDFFASSQEGFTAFWTAPDKAFVSLGFCDFFSSRYGGINEKGLTVAISNSSAYAGGTQPGITMNLATKYVIDHCASTKEAIEFLERVPHFHCFNFMLCDLQNHIARVETAPEKVVVLEYEEGFGISTNHYQSDEMKQYEKKEWLPEGGNCRRYNNAMKWFQNRKGLISFDHALKLVKNHENGLCDHWNVEGKEGGTVWSWIYSLGDSDIQIASGPPCKYEYQKYNLDF